MNGNLLPNSRSGRKAIAVKKMKALRVNPCLRRKFVPKLARSRRKDSKSTVVPIVQVVSSDWTWRLLFPSLVRVTFMSRWMPLVFSVSRIVMLSRRSGMSLRLKKSDLYCVIFVSPNSASITGASEFGIWLVNRSASPSTSLRYIVIAPSPTCRETNCRGSNCVGPLDDTAPPGDKFSRTKCTPPLEPSESSHLQPCRQFHYASEPCNR